MAIELCDYDCGFSATGQCVSCRKLICDRHSWPGRYLAAASGYDEYDTHQELIWDLAGLEDSARPWRMAELEQRAAELWDRGNHCGACVRAELEQVPAEHDAVETLSPEALLDLLYTEDFRQAYTDAGVDLAAQRIQDRLYDDPGFIPVVIAAIRTQIGEGPIWWREVLQSHRDDGAQTFALIDDEWKTFVAGANGELTEHHTVVGPARKRWFRTRTPAPVTSVTTVDWDDHALARLWSELVYAWYPQLRPDARTRQELPAEIADLAPADEPVANDTTASIPAQPVRPISPAVGIDMGLRADQSK